MRFIRKSSIAHVAVWVQGRINEAPANLVQDYLDGAPQPADGSRACDICKLPMAAHGWVDAGGPVCSGDYIFLYVYSTGRTTRTQPAVRHKAEFEAEYEAL